MTGTGEPRPEGAGWTEKLDQRDLGSLAATVHHVQEVLASDRSSLQDLAGAIGHDPALVAKILRVANSPTYHVGPEPVSSIARASTLIGFDAIRNICITSRLIEVLLSGKELSERIAERLLVRIAASLHAAIQARAMMRHAPVKEREDAFLAALLEGIGECAFWSSDGPEAEALDAALAAPDADPDTEVRRALGTSFRELSEALVRTWGLRSSAAHPPVPGVPPHAQVVRLANEVADAAAQGGWNSPRMRELHGQAARLLDAEPDEAAIRLRAWGREAEELAAFYGAAALARRMSPRPVAAEEAARRPAEPPADPGQSPRERALQAMSELAESQSDPNTVIRAAMSGIHDGLAMERTIAALLTTDRRSLQMRFTLGDGGAQWGPAFRFDAPSPRTVINDCLVEKRSVRFSERAGARAPRLPPALMRFCTGQDFLMAPIVVGGRSIGVLYADRAPSGKPIGEEEHALFSHFADRLGTCLGTLYRRRG